MKLPKPKLVLKPPKLGSKWKLPKPKLGKLRLAKPRVERRLLVLTVSLVVYALGAYGGLLAVRGALHGLVYPAWLAAVTYVGILHGAEGTLAVLALTPFLALIGYMIVVSGLLLTGGWPVAWASAPQLLAAALASAAVYASSYAAARAAVGGRVWWEAETGKQAGEGGRAPGPPRAALLGRVGVWLKRLRLGRPPRRVRRRRGGRPL